MFGRQDPELSTHHDIERERSGKLAPITGDTRPILGLSCHDSKVMAGDRRYIHAYEDH